MRYLAFPILIVLMNSFVVAASQFNIVLVDNNNQPLPNLVVYLKPADDVVLAKTDKVIEIGQFNRTFTPHISVMQLGTQVNFSNQDDITHHIYSPIGQNKFAFKIRAGQVKTKSDFQQVGEVAMGCNIHDWMSGYLLIVDTPLFGKTNDQGLIHFDLSHQGQYELVIWHPKLEAEQNRISRVVNWQQQKSMTIKVKNKIATAAAQQSDDDFDFLSDY